MKEIGVILILAIASIKDIKTKEIPNIFPLLLCCIGLIQCTWSSLAGLFLVPLPALLTSLRNPETLGGGDIKLMSGCGFCLGLGKGYLGIVFALALAIVFSKINKGKKRIAFAPYIGAGTLLAVLL